jgi:signal recognition particle receptor subunit alpha
MLNEFTIFSRGGLILFSWYQSDARVRFGEGAAQRVMSSFLRDCTTLCARKTTLSNTNNNDCLEWKCDNALSLVFVATFTNEDERIAVASFLDSIHAEFLRTACRPFLGNETFRDFFQAALEAFSARRVERQKTVQQANPKLSGDSKESYDTNKVILVHGNRDALGDTSLPSQAKHSIRSDGLNLFSQNVNQGRSESLLASWMTKMLDKSVLTRLAGEKRLENTDLDPLLEKLKSLLLDKNVASAVVEKICADTREQLMGLEISQMTSIKATIESVCKNSIRRVLSAAKDINVLADIDAAKEKRRPYTIVFIGVNGVGKSTSLSKVAAWLGANNLSLLVAACDTFRAGAVEQLRTHCQRLGVPLYERGYERDPAMIAKDAISQAKRQGIDVVLVDTAGRMQDNEPLMRSLSKLIDMNAPDLVLFVGEALVGNDAVDQIRKFNDALVDLHPQGNKRTVDGIIVSKFDAVDSKVGAALSMVHASGAPVLFLGCGQTYQDLRVPDMEHLIDLLLRK